MLRPSQILLVAALAAGCAKKIGDPCKSNVDCSALGDRFCDTSIADGSGYCTIEGCDVVEVRFPGKSNQPVCDTVEFRPTCPDDAVCVRFFTPLLSKPCDAEKIRAGCAADEEGCCASDERCVCDRVDPTGCAGNAGHCAPESTERRSCQERCERNSDCRAGFECRAIGTRGAQAVPTVCPYTKDSTARFCVWNG